MPNASSLGDLAGWSAAHAARVPDAPAVIHDDRRLDWAALDDRVIRLAGLLATRGVGPGVAVATLVPNSLEMVVAILATWRAGGVALPINPQYREGEIEAILSEAAPVAILVAPDLTALVDGILERRSTPPPIRLVTGDGQATGRTHFADLDEGKGPGSSPPAPALDPNRPGLWLYSSGSTGGSKKISRSIAQLEAEAEAFHRGAATRADDVFVCSVPLSHAHGLGNGLLAALRVGGTLVVQSRFDRRSFLRLIEVERATIVPASPFMFKVLASTNLEREPDLSSVRLCFTAGAPLPADIFEATRNRFGLDVRQLYGTTESGAVCLNLADDVASCWDSVGQPLEPTEIEIFDDAGRPVEPGIEGRIGIRGPSLFDGYGRADLDARALRDGWFLPGDLGTRDEEGLVRITGRETQFINLSGNKVDPREVEGLLQTHPKVSEAVVVGARTSSGLEFVKAVVVAEESCTNAELVEYCRGRLADFKVPRVIELVDEIPRNPLGKILRKYLTEPT